MTQHEMVPVSTARHGTRFWRRFASYDFVRRQRLVPLVLAEIAQAACALPIVFARTDDGLGPVALLRMNPDDKAANETPLVSADGLWRGGYVPSALRVYPFTAAEAADGRMVLLIDEASGLVTDHPGDERFFTPQGRLDPSLDAVVDFFRRRTASALETRTACAALDALHLFRPFAPLPDMTAAQCEGLYMLDSARVAALSETNILTLHRARALLLMHAHFVAHGHCRWLQSAERLANDTPLGFGPKRHDAGGDTLSGFLDALARSHQNDSTVAAGLDAFAEGLA